MDVHQISTMGDFRAFLIFFSEDMVSTYDGRPSLEEYLRALWSLVRQHRDIAVSWRLFGELFYNAFTKEPPLFDDSWLTYQSPPDAILKRQPPKKDGYEELQQMILYQIADLHQMEQAGWFNDEKKIYRLWFGQENSPTGFRWSNFFLPDYLHNGTGGMVPNSPVVECTWLDLAIILWLNQIYE